jgi:hypothetical protein
MKKLWLNMLIVLAVMSSCKNTPAERHTCFVTITLSNYGQE